ncbi:hypothetical protein Gotur_017820 [Gossypium turneri]
MKQSSISLTNLIKGLHQSWRWWLYRGGMISRRKNGWQLFRIFEKMISNGELLGCFQMRSYIDVVILIGSPYLGFRVLLAMHRC